MPVSDKRQKVDVTADTQATTEAIPASEISLSDTSITTSAGIRDQDQRSTYNVDLRGARKTISLNLEETSTTNTETTETKFQSFDVTKESPQSAPIPVVSYLRNEQKINTDAKCCVDEYKKAISHLSVDAQKKALGLYAELDRNHREKLFDVVRKYPDVLTQTDSHDVALIDRLHILIDPNLRIHKSLNGLDQTSAEIKEEVLNSLIEKLDNQGHATQSNKATCTMCADSIEKFQANPAEFTRVTSEWLTKGVATLASGVKVNLNAADVIATQNEGTLKHPRRDLVDRMYQESACKWMVEELVEWGGTRGSYNSADTTWANRNGQRIQGFYPQQQQLWDQAFTNQKKEILFAANSTKSEMLTAISNEIKAGGAVKVHLDWDTDGMHSKHSVLVTDIVTNENGELEVIYNAYGENEFRKMDLIEFKGRLIEAIVTDANGGNIAEATSNPEGYNYKYAKDKDGTLIINARPPEKEPERIIEMTTIERLSSQGASFNKRKVHLQEAHRTAREHAQKEKEELMRRQAEQQSLRDKKKDGLPSAATRMGLGKEVGDDHENIFFATAEQEAKKKLN